METNNSDNATINNADATVGQFVRLVNTIEFLINTSLESIIVSYSASLPSPEAAHDTIDHIEEQSIRTRINLIILFLTMTKGEQTDVQALIITLKEFSVKYNKDVRPLRDFVAHNPFISSSSDESSKSLIISSRKYKGKLNFLSMKKLEITTKEVIPMVHTLHRIAAAINSHYPAAVVRDFS